MRFVLIATLLAAATASSPATAEVYRCTLGGKTVYSDRPCGDSAASVVVPVPPPAPAPAINLDNESNLGRVAVGMTPQQVERAWGRPKSINTDIRANGRHEQWVYDRKDGDAYVYVENGKVSSISTSSPGFMKPGDPARAQPPVEVAPTKRELEARERAEKAGERRFMTNTLRLNQAQVRARLGEPDEKQFVGNVEYWTYLPARLDYQTRTVIKFDNSGFTFDVERDVQR